MASGDGQNTKLFKTKNRSSDNNNAKSCSSCPSLACQCSISAQTHATGTQIIYTLGSITLGKIWQATGSSRSTVSSHFDEPRVPSKDRCKESPHHGISSLHSSTCSEASSCCNPALACRTCGGQMRSPEEEELGGQSHIFLLYTGKGRPEENGFVPHTPSVDASNVWGFSPGCLERTPRGAYNTLEGWRVKLPSTLVPHPCHDTVWHWSSTGLICLHYSWL